MPPGVPSSTIPKGAAAQASASGGLHPPPAPSHPGREGRSLESLPSREGGIVLDPFTLRFAPDPGLHQINTRFGLAPDRLTEVVAGDLALRAPGSLDAATRLPAISPWQQRLSFVRELRRNPALVRQHAATKANYAAYHLPTFSLAAALVFPIGAALDALGLHDADAHFAATTLLLHPAGGMIDRGAQVVVNRIAGRTVGSMAVDFVGQAAREGVTELRVIPRQAGIKGTVRSLALAVAHGLLPDGPWTTKILAGAKGGAFAIVKAPFHMATGLLFADGLDAAMRWLGGGEAWMKWRHRGTVKAATSFAPDAANAASGNALQEFLLKTSAGRAILGLAKVSAGLFVFNLAAWGINRWKHGADRDAVGDRAAETGEAVARYHPILATLRELGIAGDGIDLLAAGEYPGFSRLFDAAESWGRDVGTHHGPTMAELREEVRFLRRVEGAQGAEELRALVREHIRRSMEYGGPNLFDGVDLPKFVTHYDPRFEALYDRIRQLDRLRTDDPQAWRIAHCFTTDLRGSTKEDPLPTGTPILEDPADLKRQLGGDTLFVHEPRQFALARLIETKLRMEQMGATAGDLRILAAALRREAAVEGVSPEAALAGALEETADSIAAAEARGLIDEAGEIRADADYFAALEVVAAQTFGDTDAEQQAALREWMADRAILLSLPDLPLEARARFAAEIAAADPERAFGEGSLAATILRAVVRESTEAARATDLRPAAPEADAALRAAADRAIAAARQAIALGVQSRAGDVPSFGLAHDFATIQAMAEAHEALARQADYDAAAITLTRLTEIHDDPSTDDNGRRLADHYQHGGEGSRIELGETHEGSRVLAHDLVAAEADWEAEVLEAGSLPRDAALGDVAATLRQAVRFWPEYAAQMGIDPRTGAFASAAALRDFVMPRLHEDAAREVTDRLLARTAGVYAGIPKLYTETKKTEARTYATALRDRFAGIIAGGVALGHVTADAQTAWLSRALQENPDLAREVQAYLVLHARARRNADIGGSSSAIADPLPSPEMFSADGRIADAAAVTAWVEPYLPPSPQERRMMEGVAAMVAAAPAAAWPKTSAFTVSQRWESLPTHPEKSRRAALGQNPTHSQAPCGSHHRVSGANAPDVASIENLTPRNR
ncbi:MAG: hypothetical protein HY543_11730 [Deltaproteobacteria bacterium]|nr:hypothetical protein [Deltaproteobacteria bacterium]